METSKPAITIERAAELSGSSKGNIKRAKAIVDSGILALELESTIAARSKQGERTDICQKSDNSSPLDTKREIASIAGVSHDTVAKVKKIKALASEEMLNATFMQQAFSMRHRWGDCGNDGGDFAVVSKICFNLASTLLQLKHPFSGHFGAFWRTLNFYCFSVRIAVILCL